MASAAASVTPKTNRESFIMPSLSRGRFGGPLQLSAEEKQPNKLYCGLPFSSKSRSEGLEPPTYKFVACCSIQLSYDRASPRDESPRDLPEYVGPEAIPSEREGFEPSIRLYIV